MFANLKMTEPHADNWLRVVGATVANYQVAIVPAAMKADYMHYFDHIIRHASHRIVNTYRASTIQNMLHGDRLDALHKDQAEFVRKYYHTGYIFDGLQCIFVSKNNGRPFQRDFDEDEFLKALRRVLSMKPSSPNRYATALRFNIGKGIVTTMPILVVDVVINIAPLPIRPFDS